MDCGKEDDMTFRVRESNREAVAQLFPEAVFGPPPRRLNGGCSDARHCPQHPGVTEDGEPMVGVTVNCSGTEFHRRLVAAGLAEE